MPICQNFCAFDCRYCEGNGMLSTSANHNFWNVVLYCGTVFIWLWVLLSPCHQCDCDIELDQLPGSVPCYAGPGWLVPRLESYYWQWFKHWQSSVSQGAGLTTLYFSDLCKLLQTNIWWYFEKCSFGRKIYVENLLEIPKTVIAIGNSYYR